MCQIMALNNLSNIDNFELVAKTIQTEITKRNRDGFGLAVNSEIGTAIFKTVDYAIKYEPKQYESLKSIVASNNFRYTGNHDFESPRSAIFHGRISTNKPGLHNAHPIALNNQCIVHNGVVDVETDYKQILDTDTELLTTIQSDLISNLENKVSGYYAFFNLHDNGNITVVRDNIATIYISFIEDLDTYIMGTDIDLIKNVCSALDWTYSSIYLLQDNTVFNISPDNVISDVLQFTPMGFKSHQAALSDKSLGRALHVVDSDDSHLYEKYVESEYIRELVLSQFDDADPSWTFHYENRLITLLQFRELSDDQKLSCHVVDWQGLEVSIDSTLKSLDDSEYYNYKTN